MSDTFDRGEYDAEMSDLGEPDGLDMPGVRTKRTKAQAADRPTGAGPCPKCGGPTRLIQGSRDPFHGCLAFPACKGTRAADEDEATDDTQQADAWKRNRRMPKEIEAP